MSIRDEKGFVALELLVFAQLTLLLAASSLNGAREKAMEASFKAMASSIQAPAVLCCDMSGHLQATVSGKICSSDDVWGNYPDADQIASVKVVKDCDSKGDFEVVMAANKKMKNISQATCTATRCKFE